MASVTLEGVYKRFAGGGEAARDVSFHVADGELVSLVGPSGCGKSTLLNLVAGLEQISAGTIRIDDVVVNDRSPGERDVAMVFQSYALYPHLTVRQNLSFPLEVARLPRGEIASRIEDTSSRLEIGALLDRKPAQLSGGQRQRVALGRALVRRPKLFLFDEPLSNLDAVLRTQMRGELKKLHESLRATFLYVTHDQAEAMTLSDRVVVLAHGEVQQIAPPREIYARPANTFVAGFFGSPQINLVSLRALRLGDRDTAIAGVRPEAMEVGLGAADADAIAGRVFLVEPMGAESWVTVEIERERVVARAPANFSAQTGDAAWVRFSPADVMFFDRASGQAISSA